MGGVVSLAFHLSAERWERACAVAVMLQDAERDRLQAKSDALRAWRERPREPAPVQERLPL